MSLLTISKAQKQIAEFTREKRLSMGLTQSGLANRAGVSLSTLRKFEQKAVISLESYLKLLMVLNQLENFIEAIKPESTNFQSIDDVLNDKKRKRPKKGWRS